MKRVETITQEAPPALPVSAVARDVGATTAVTVGLPSAKVKDGHRQRKAIVYIRQSTPQQVLEHRESADRQYSLVHRAALLGLPIAWRSSTKIKDVAGNLPREDSASNTCWRRLAWTTSA